MLRAVWLCTGMVLQCLGMWAGGQRDVWGCGPVREELYGVVGRWWGERLVSRLGRAIPATSLGKGCKRWPCMVLGVTLERCTGDPLLSPALPLSHAHMPCTLSLSTGDGCRPVGARDGPALSCGPCCECVAGASQALIPQRGQVEG